MSDADSTSTLLHRQHAFAAYLRDPDNTPAPENIEERRLKIYRDLFFNNVCLLLGNAFPVLSELLGERRWKLLIRDYYRDHKSHSPLFPDMPKEFLDYLANERAGGIHTDTEADFPFMYELAHYEWVETGLLLATEKPAPANLDPQGDLLEQIPVASSLAWLFGYRYAVNEIGGEQIPDGPAEQPLHFLIYRDEQEKVQFIKLNIVSASLFEIIAAQSGLSGKQVLEKIAAQLNHPDPDKVIAGGLSILEQWREKNIVLGTVANVD